ncbi:hypothetical protein K435DRAFT_874071 [Dendrothele bispora CBS 962.96]|uniref:NACHT domain-containing protein n=1 Tax=Dendrothele bispora (strain CBS 962.96) TaxID=1314807 RepID=A0A4S8KXJ2_DENBC|nr:hypothetical protein K435DRAFT_874071 [Dendrothele bispora CBS 962.96]
MSIQHRENCNPPRPRPRSKHLADIPTSSRVERISLLLKPLAEDTDSAKLRIVLTDGSKKLYRTEYCTEKGDEHVWRNWNVDIELPCEKFTAEVQNRETLLSHLLAIAKVDLSGPDPANDSNTLSKRTYDLKVIKPGKWGEMSVQFDFSKLSGNTPGCQSAEHGSEDRTSRLTIDTTRRNLELAHERAQNLESKNLNKVLSYLDTLTKILSATSSLAEMLPLAKTVHGTLTKACKLAQAKRDEDEEIQRLTSTMLHMLESLIAVKEIEKIQKLKTIVELAMAALNSAANFIVYYTTFGFWRRTLLAEEGKKIRELKQTFEFLTNQFDTAVNVQILQLTDDTLKMTINMFLQLSAREDNDILERLAERLRAYNANYDHKPGCLPGTQKHVLQRIDAWISNVPSADPIFWLSGVAGSGKSTIASTVVRLMKKEKEEEEEEGNRTLLGAVYFCRRNVTMPEHVVPAIAYRLACSFPPLRARIINAIRDCPDVTGSPISTQFSLLLAKPLSALDGWDFGKSSVIVIDALDECGSQATRKELLQCFTNPELRLPPWFKLLITSRPEHDLARAFADTSRWELSIKDAKQQEAIELYAESRMKEMSEDDAQILAFNLILDSSNLEAALDKVRSSFSDIDSLYRTVFCQFLGNSIDTPLLRDILGFVIASEVPWTLDIICHTFERKGSYKARAVRKGRDMLASILIDHSHCIQVLHPSLVDFLTDKERSASTSFFIARDEYVQCLHDIAPQLHDDGISSLKKYKDFHKLTDLDWAISLLQRAMYLIPGGHHDKAAWLTNLGNAFSCRFECLGELKDIENAILFHQQALDLIPDGHADNSEWLSNLGNALQRRFERLGGLEDIENAVLFHQQVLDLIPDGHANYSGQLNNLGNALQRRFERLGEFRDIENAILCNQQALDLTPDGHADKARRLSNLGNALQSRFECLGELRDIENAILVNQQAVDLTPDGHASKATQLTNLGSAFESRFGCVGELQDIMKATIAYKQATENTSSHPFTQYDAACRWAILSSKHQSPSSALNAYTVVLGIIPQIVWLGQTVHYQYVELPKVGRTITGAAAMAISVGDLSKAVEWLEEGRSIFWKQLLQLRTPLDELHQHPDIANELSGVSLALDNAGTSSIQNIFQNIDLAINHRSVEEEAQNHHGLAAQYEELLQKVRGLDGFGSFLRPKKFSELAPAARNGPVVIINVHHSCCDALVMHSDLILSLKAGNAREPRQLPPDYNVSSSILKEILGKLWDFVAHPILSAAENILHENIHDSLPHITWCATGASAFLPLHAAGIYGSDDPTKNMNISDFAVSSYTTTLTALLDSGSKLKQDPTKTPSVLIVSQPGTEDEFLPTVAQEVEVIQHYTSPDHTCHLTHELATVGAVLDEMSKHEIIHLACHGIQDMENPLNSAFDLYDGRLSLSTLMRLSLKKAELAVLSTGETAIGDERFPEEAIHLAAGMLAIGYSSVIATMWFTEDASLIADKLYENLLGHYDNSESQKAKLTPAYALHEAVKHLRETVGEMNFVKWVPFIHLGV